MYSVDKLKEIVRYEIEDIRELNLFEDEYGEFVHPEFSGNYTPTADDLITACTNFIEKKVGLSAIENWYTLISADLEEYFNYAFNFGIMKIEDYLPKDEESLFHLIANAIEYLTWQDVLVYEGHVDFLKDIIKLKDNYEENKEKDLLSYKLTNYQFEEVVHFIDLNKEKIPKSYLEVCRKIIDDGCEKKNECCMQLKGYGCYGGDILYDCDWEISKQLITELFDVTGDPNFANTLGYIYYYGRCNDGIPEYDKAFQYFSVGAAHGILESLYKISDMFKAGKGIIKSPKTAEHIIQELYEDTKPRFSMGEDAKFADIALRRADFYKDRGLYKAAFITLLEARCAIKLRLKDSKFFGDKKVAESIENSILDLKKKLPEDFFKEKLESDFPYILTQFMDGDNCKVTIEPLFSDHFRLTLTKKKKSNATPALIVVPELEESSLTRKISIKINHPKVINYASDDKCNIHVNRLGYRDDTVVFHLGDKEVISIVGAEYVIDNSIFDGK